MKKLIAIAMAAMATMFAVADEEITMVEKEITTVTVPFAIRGYIPSNKDVVRIEKTSDSALRITALTSGRCDLEVRGDMDLVQKFQISVGGDLPRMLATLRRELESIPAVHADIIGNSIRIDGEVKSIKKWNYLMKVLKGYPQVRNFAEFKPGDDLLVKMKENLQQCGFEVVFSPFASDQNAWKANCVALSYNDVNRTMNIQAKVYTPEQQAQIIECVKREKAWLAIDKDTADAKNAFDDEFQIKANIQVFVAKPVIRLSVAYMAIGEEDIRKVGNVNANRGEGAGVINGFFNTVQNLVRGGGNSHSATIGASLDVTTRFLAQNSLNRVSDTGYTLLESWDPEGARFKSGGTRFVKVYGRDVAELKEIEYGFIINAKGGMVNENNMSIDFDFTLSTIVPMDDETYDRKEDLTKQKITCALGRTTLISGFKDLVDKNTPPSGIPFLRSTPILNWFVADSNKEISDRKLIIMVCPEIVDSTQDGDLNVDREINIPTQAIGSKSTDETLKERKEKEGFTGFWSWLNWFTW